jgi:nicotinate phosphoribosyltransferase
MAYGHWKTGSHTKEAVYHLSFRKNPFNGGYAVCCGLSTMVDFINNFRFDKSDIDYLSTLKGHDGKPLFEDRFLQYLSDLKLNVDIDAVPDGTIVFAHEPLVRVKGPIVHCQLLETALLTIFNFQTLIATKAARIREAAGQRSILEFGLRRAQGIDGGLTASLAAHIGGCDATSNVLAGKLFGIPVSGTHAHSWVMSFDDELEAFKAYAAAMPNNCVFLVDTYDTVDGVANAIEAAKWLKKTGHQFLGIRLDSGDLAYLSIEARKMLDEAGFKEAVIVASNDLDEHIINSLNAQHAQINVWGVGTKLVTAYDQPALGGVYKLSAVREPGQSWQYKVKLSEQAIKVSNPGIQQVRRFLAEDGHVADMIFNIEAEPKSDFTIVDPLDMTRRKKIGSGCRHHDLLVPIIASGRQVYSVPSLEASKNYVREQLQNFHFTYKRILNPHQYPVGLEIGLHEVKTALILEERENLQKRKETRGRTRMRPSDPIPPSTPDAISEDVTIMAKPRQNERMQHTAEPPTLPQTLEKAALIVVDAQRGFGSSGELPVPRAEEIVPVVNELADKFPLVVATQDWHPADHVSFAINHAGKNIGDTIRNDSYEQPLFPMHCIENTNGSKFLDNLDTEKFSQVFKKGMDPDVDCFSGFFDCAGGMATEMDAFLRANGVEHIFIAGLATNYCVKETALDGVKLGYKVTLVEDACRGIDRVGLRVKTAIEQMKNGGIAFVASAELNYPKAKKQMSASQSTTSLKPKGKSGKRNALCLWLCLSLSLACSMPAFAVPKAKAIAKAKAKAAPSADSDSIVIDAMVGELNRSFTKLKSQGAAPLYFLSYRVCDTDSFSANASYGAITNFDRNHSRLLDIEARVGSAQLDSTHKIRSDRFDGEYYPRLGGVEFSIDNDPDAIACGLWYMTDKAFKDAQQSYVQVKANKEVKVDEEDVSDDFGPGKVVVSVEKPLKTKPDDNRWIEPLRRMSAIYKQYPEITTSYVSVDDDVTTRYITNSEGTKVQQSQKLARMLTGAGAICADGMEVNLYDTVEAFDINNLPSEEEFSKRIKALAEAVVALRNSHAGEPYVGPAILMPKAAGVFFHEVLGHRVEGHRQKDEEEGRTFTKKVGAKIMPEFISVIDDPTIDQLGNTPLIGNYRFDDEGMPAQKVQVVEQGVLRNFLMGRSPIASFKHSNGHCRCQPGSSPVARQGNLIVESNKQVTEAKLRELLIEETKRQGKQYGLMFDEIAGGFTITQAFMPQSFSLLPLQVKRVWVDGRPDELLRGVNLVGTPLASLETIMCASDRVGTFNGVCGAESGWVPVSASAPSLLVRTIEVAREEKAQDKPPVLPPPNLEKAQR